MSILNIYLILDCMYYPYFFFVFWEIDEKKIKGKDEFSFLKNFHVAKAGIMRIGITQDNECASAFMHCNLAY